MEKKDLKTYLKAILISIIFGIIVWLIDSIIDWMYFYDGTFLEILIYQVPSHEIYIRSVFFIALLVFALLNAHNQIKLKNSHQNIIKKNHELDALNQQLGANEQQLRANEQQLRATIHQLQASENELTKKAHDLDERVKELNGLYNISESIWENKNIDNILQDAVNYIPPSWQYPEITSGRITFNEKTFVTNNFIESKWAQSTFITVDSKIVGKIEVFYNKEMPILDEGPFMHEERKLIDAISINLGRAVEKISYQNQLEIERSQLKQQQKQFKAIFNGIDGIMYVSDPDTFEIVHANDIALKAYGDDIIGKKCFEAFHGKSSACEFCTNDKILGENLGKTYIWEAKNESNNRWFRCADKAIIWPDGRKLRFELATDITEQVVLNEKLVSINHQLATNEEKLRYINNELIAKQQANEDLKIRFQLANESAGIGVWDLDLKKNILIWDKWMYQLYGVNPDEFEGAYEAWQKGVHPEDIDRASKEVDLAIKGEKEFDSEFRVLTPNNKVRHLKASAIIIKDANDDPIKMIGVNYDISHLKETEAKLITNEQRYKQAESIANVGSWEYNIQSDYFWGSDETKRIYGFHKDEDQFTPDEVESCIPERERVHQALIDLIEKDKPYNIEFEIIQKGTKESRFIKSIAILEKDNEGNPLKVSGAILDITQQIIAEKKLKESKERFELAVKASKDGIWDWNIITNEVYYSPGWGKILELDNIPQNFSTWTSRIHPEEKKTILESIQSHLTNDSENWEMEHRLKLPNGNYKWVLGKGKIVKRDANGKPTRMVGSMTDIQQRKNNEMQLITEKKRAEENEFRFKSLHNASFGGITIHDKGLILDCNHGLSQITGYTHDELIGMDGLLLISEDTRDFVLSQILSKYEKPYEAIGLRKNGETYPLRLEAREIPYKNKKVRVVEFRDITDEKKIEEQLVHAKKKAEESDQLKSAFLANMSHEIRTPMNGILGFTSLLEEPDLTNDELSHYIEIIKRSGFRMLDTVNDIIDISKIDSGQMEVNISDVDICQEISSLHEFFQPEAAKKGLALHLDNRLDKTRPILLKTDLNKITSIVTNLIKNAIKYTDSGEINIIVEKQKNAIKCSVKDTGIGIPSVKLKSIFNRFVQADIKDARAYEGAGLGLSITKSYVEMLHGKISVTSAENKGSCFTFTLPISTP